MQFSVCMCVFKYHGIVIQRYVFKIFIFNYVSVCVCMYLCKCPQGPEASDSLGTGVTRSCELPSVGFRDHTPSLEQCGLLTAELSPQLHRVMFILATISKDTCGFCQFYLIGDS